MSLVIGLHGAKGSGKDQFYKAVKAAYPLHPVRKIAYADPIKNEVCRIFGLKDEQEYDDFKRTEMRYQIPNKTTRSMDLRSVEGRQVVREIGMLMRSYDPNQFVRYVEETIESEPGAVWCITDLRFPNELLSIKSKLGGTVVKIKRNGVNFDGHVTETEFHDSVCDYVVYNTDLTLNQYNELAIETMERILDASLYNGEEV